MVDPCQDIIDRIQRLGNNIDALHTLLDAGLPHLTAKQRKEAQNQLAADENKLTLAKTALQVCRDQNREITEFELTCTNSGPLYIVSGPDGNLWFTEKWGNRIGRITTKGHITEFPVYNATTGRGTPDSQPFIITRGPDVLDKNLYFTEFLGNKIGKINTDDGNIIDSKSLPLSDSQPRFITPADKYLWFVEYNTSKIGCMDPTDLTLVAEFPILLNDNTSGPSGIVADKTGQTLWITASKSGKIYTRSTSLDPNTLVTEVPVGLLSDSEPTSITLGPDLNLWFTERHAKQIGRIIPDEGNKLTEFPRDNQDPPLSGQPIGITRVLDVLWFVEGDGNMIAQITTKGHITEFSVPTPQSNPNAITAGLDGNIWFTERAGNKIGRKKLP